MGGICVKTRVPNSGHLYRKGFHRQIEVLDGGTGGGVAQRLNAKA